MMPPLLSVEDLTVTLAGRDAVSGLSFALDEGEMLALIGESGSGKSMTAAAIMGLVPRSSAVRGAIRLSGRNLVPLPEAKLRKLRGRDIAMIFQEPMTAFNPVMTVGRQIMEVIELHEGARATTARDRALDLLARVRIADPARCIDAYPHQLSGGMQQRVMIAMAIAGRPRLLIADEPTTALDVATQAEVMALLDDLRRQLNMAVLLISHDLTVVERWADRIVVLYAGRPVEQGAAASVLARPSHPYTRQLLAASLSRGPVRHYSEGRLPEMARDDAWLPSARGTAAP